VLGPFINDRREVIQKFQIGVLILVGFSIAHDGRPQVVECKREITIPKLPHDSCDFRRLRSGDKPLGHPLNVLPSIQRQRSLKDTIRLRNAHSQTDRPGHELANFLVVFLKVTRDLIVCPQHRQNVHESKHLYLD